MIKGMIPNDTDQI